jgi:hypothetical protein
MLASTRAPLLLAMLTLTPALGLANSSSNQFAGLTTILSIGPQGGQFTLPADATLTRLSLDTPSEVGAVYVLGPSGGAHLFKLKSWGDEFDTEAQSLPAGDYVVYLLGDSGSAIRAQLEFDTIGGEDVVSLSEPVRWRTTLLQPSGLTSMLPQDVAMKFTEHTPSDSHRQIAGFLEKSRWFGPRVLSEEYRWWTSKGLVACFAVDSEEAGVGFSTEISLAQWDGLPPGEVTMDLLRYSAAVTTSHEVRSFWFELLPGNEIPSPPPWEFNLLWKHGLTDYDVDCLLSVAPVY